MFKTIKNQKGMTLVELLAVMVIVGIIAAISIPAIGNLMENTRKDAHISNAQALQESARLWVTSNEAYLTEFFTTPANKEVKIELSGTAWTVTGGELQSIAPFDGYMETFIDPHSKQPYTSADVTIKKDGNAFKYTVSLKGAKMNISNVDAMKLTRKDIKPS